MRKEEDVRFGSFRLEPASGRLRRGREEVALSPKAFALLEFFLRHPGRLLTKNEILDTVWSGTHVADGALKVCVSELRRALGDTVAHPRYVETVHRRGYRFVAAVSGGGAEASPRRSLLAWAPVPAGSHGDLVVGRDAELGALERLLESARRGARRFVWVSGEPGIGKTALVSAFTRRLASADVWLSGGQCVDGHGAGEGYLPVLEAAARLARVAPQWVAVLERHAPSWVAQMPSLASRRPPTAPDPASASRERMPREFAEAIEAIDGPTLVLVVEDLHWSDVSTVDLLALLARRTDPARLLVVVTSRPPESREAEDRLRSLRALVGRGPIDEIRLAGFDPATLGDYVAQRFPENGFPSDLVPALHGRTGGLPLFVVATFEDALGEGTIAEVGDRWVLRDAPSAVLGRIADGIRSLVQLRQDRASAEDRALLDAASVAGDPVSAALLADVLGIERDEAEARCDRLARPGSFFVPCGVDADSPEPSAAYAFRHAIFQAVIYDRIGEARRARLHRAVAEHLLRRLGHRVSERAAELSLHFERAGELGPAATWALVAAEASVGAAEAVMQSRRGLALLDRIPPTPERTIERLRFEVTIGRGAMAERGYTDAEVAGAFARAERLACEVGDLGERARIRFGLGHHELARGALSRAEKLLAIGLGEARAAGRSELLVPLGALLGVTLVYQGRIRQGLEHARRARDADRTAFHALYPPLVGYRAQTLCRFVEAVSLWILGFADRAVECIDSAIAEARGHPFTLALALANGAWIAGWRGEDGEAVAHAEELIAVSREQGFPYWEAWGTWSRGLALVGLGSLDAGATEMSRGIANLRSIGEIVSLSRALSDSAEALARTGRTGEARALIDEALEVSGRAEDVYWRPETLRVRGELLVDGGDRSEGERWLRRSLDEAAAAGMLALELRAATSLARASRGVEARKRAVERLTRVYGRFSEGFATRDLRDARAILDRRPDAARSFSRRRR